MSYVEELHQAAIDRMTPAEKVARCQEMFNWSREFIARQIQSEHPNASIERIKLLVAMRMYGAEPGMKKLLEGLLANVPD
jgi:hypothetical protein